MVAKKPLTELPICCVTEKTTNAIKLAIIAYSIAAAPDSSRHNCPRAAHIWDSPCGLTWGIIGAKVFTSRKFPGPAPRFV